ncbi:MAG: hypothetical protein WA364_11730 [Candidatus Nitrosopolaris sp.]
MEIDRHLKIGPVLWRRVKAVQSDVTISELVTSAERWRQTGKCTGEVKPWYHVFFRGEPYAD